MKNFFRYSVLQYIHTQGLGEAINIGILLFFPHQGKVVFKYPAGFLRIASLYKGFSAAFIRTYLRGFEKRAAELSKNREFMALLQNTVFTDNLDDLISKEFLRKDATVLRFTQTNIGVLYTEDTEKITDDFYKLYFSNYEDEPEILKKHNEQYIVRSYKNLLLAKDKNIEQYLQAELEIAVDQTSLKAALAWQNGTLNLVKPLSFDLVKAESINNKALVYAGKLNYLGELAAKENKRFDLLLTRPQQKSLFAAYDKALNILNDARANKKIVEEEELEAYSENTVKTIVRN